jgi:hypothetical protein
MPTLQETHHGIVTNVNDPEQRGRVMVRCQGLVGADYELPFWAEPLAQVSAGNGGCGSLFLPTVGSTVELVVDAHDTDLDDMPGERFLSNPSLKWRFATYTDNKGVMPLPAALRANYPKRSGFVTPGGHQLIFDDSGSVLIKANGGNAIEFKPDGSIVLTAPMIAGDGASELMVLGNALMTLFNTHTHPTGVGPSGPPTQPMTAVHLSQTGNKVS